jgi:hypothetical protein
LLGNPATHRFITTDAEIVHDGLRVPHDYSARLGLTPGQACWVMPLDW